VDQPEKGAKSVVLCVGCLMNGDVDAEEMRACPEKNTEINMDE